MMRRTLVKNSLGKTVMFGGDARERMLGGIERIAKAVGVTLGPKGRNVIIRLEDGEPKITKDGVTVARSIDFNDQFEDLGARLIRQVASNTNDVAGDGTTTATILAWSIFAEGYKCVATGANPMDLKRGIDIAVQDIIQSLKLQTRKVNDFETLSNVATISANGERRMGNLIAEAVQSVGRNGYISVLDGASSVTTWVKHDGWSAEVGFSDSALVTDQEKLTSELENCAVFVTAEPIQSVDATVSLLGAALGLRKPLVVICPQISPEAMQTILLNHKKGSVRTIVCAVQQPLEVFEDVALSCNCNVESVESIGRVASAEVLFGSATKVTQSMDSTVVSGSADTTHRRNLLQSKLERCMTESEREILRERIAKLSRTFAVIRVGGRSAVEVSEAKDRVIDALNASRNALAEGIVAGGGAALLHATKRLDIMMMEDEDMEQDRRMGILIVRNAARLPMRLIGDNAGEEGAVIVSNVSEFDDTSMGYDAQNNKYVNMFEAGIIDPVKVVSSCVMDAASVAGLMITTEASVCDFEVSRSRK